MSVRGITAAIRPMDTTYHIIIGVDVLLIDVLCTDEWTVGHMLVRQVD